MEPRTKNRARRIWSRAPNKLEDRLHKLEITLNPNSSLLKLFQKVRSKQQRQLKEKKVLLSAIIICWNLNSKQSTSPKSKISFKANRVDSIKFLWSIGRQASPDQKEASPFKRSKDTILQQIGKKPRTIKRNLNRLNSQMKTWIIELIPNQY